MQELHYNGSWRVFTPDTIHSFDLDGSSIDVKVFIDVISHSGPQFFPRFITFFIETINHRYHDGTGLLYTLFSSHVLNFVVLILMQMILIC